jgi:transcriptional regulator with XRE-family HTH domain
MTIGDRIKELRIKNNYNQEELAKLLGVTSRAVSGWETDYRFPRAKMLEDIAKIFGVTTDYLLNGDLQDLEEIDADAVQLIRRINTEITEEDKKKILDMIRFMLEQSK